MIDPGGDADRILSEIQRLGLTITDIIHTHAHLDHILAAGEIKKATGATISVHLQDKFLWDDVERQCQRFGVPYTPQPDPDRWLQDDEELACCAGVTMHTPGHTPGSLCFLFEQYSLLVAGDTLFKRSIGRTDFEYGDFSAIENSIKHRLLSVVIINTLSFSATLHGTPTDRNYGRPFQLFKQTSHGGVSVSS